MNRWHDLAALTLSILFTNAACAADAQWPVYAGDAGGRQYSALDQINADNVGQLAVAWQYRTGELERHPDAHNATAKVQVNPILLPPAAGGHLVICTPFNRIVALNPADGTERWVYDPAVRVGGYATADDPEGLAAPAFANCRGVTYWQDKQRAADADCRHRILTATNDLRLIAVDAKTGERCADFGQDGIVDIEPDVLNAHPPAAIGEVRFSNPPVVLNDIVMIGSGVRDNHRYNAPNGAVRAFDVRTGTPRWTFDPVPRDPDDPIYAGWPDDSAAHTGGANVWGLISVDATRDLAFLPTSGPSPDFYGGTRPGDNRYADSIVALRGTTGRVVWHFQTVHHDVWDYDNAAQPTLVDLEKDGEPFPAVIQATKTGMIYIFHRETGEPYFPIEERPVPQDGVPGEVLSPTQPFPTKPPPLVPHGIGPDDFWGITVIDERMCRKKYAGARLGPIFTPPARGGSVLVRATAGGMNWGGVAVDPQQKILVAKALRLAHFAQLIPLEQLDAVIASSGENMMGTPAPLIGTPYALKQGPFVSPMFTPCIAPPWSALVAVDIEAGEILWQSTLGTLDALVPLPLPLRWGTASFGGPIVTGGGLVFIGATQDDRFRAFDLHNGKELWSFKLPTGSFATPMTYALDGRQYVVVASGGHPFVYPYPGDYLTAFALPRR